MVGTRIGCKVSFMPGTLIVIDENHYDILLPYQTSVLFQFFVKQISPAFMESIFEDEQRENPQHRTVCDSMAWHSIHSSQGCVHSLGASSVPFAWEHEYHKCGHVVERSVILNIEPDAVFQRTHTLSESLLSPFLVEVGILTLGVISNWFPGVQGFQFSSKMRPLENWIDCVVILGVQIL